MGRAYALPIAKEIAMNDRIHLTKQYFLVYNEHSLRIAATCETEAGAKRSMAAHNRRLNKRGELAEYQYCSEAKYAELDVMVPTHNMLNPDGPTIWIRKSQKGGCCDPATNTYHEM